jgi:hypothetical protein
MSYVAEAIAFCRMMAYSEGTRDDLRLKWMRLLAKFLDVNSHYIKDDQLEALEHEVDELKKLVEERLGE